MTSKKKIGFLYFEEIHHIAHFIGIAAELSKLENHHIDILTYRDNHQYLYKLINILEAENINVIQLKEPSSRFILDKITGRKKPSPVYLYKKHKTLLLNYDALVFTELNHTYIHKYKNAKSVPKLIFVNHGPGGRGYTFQFSIKLFDLILLPGEFYVKRLKAENLLIENHSVVGYSKFDVVKAENQDKAIFSNNKPTVLYNPHFNKVNSSWYNYGESILAYFYNSEDFNLIFAPHIYLFNRRGFLKPSIIDDKYFKKDNIHIDLGSINSSNMTYSLNSDVYLGDVSSQVYEFHVKPRPCIFINSKKVDWQEDINYRFWKTGDVIDSIDMLDNILMSLDKKETYLRIQKGFFDENFITDLKCTASKKGAKAIDEFLSTF